MANLVVDREVEHPGECTAATGRGPCEGGEVREVARGHLPDDLDARRPLDLREEAHRHVRCCVEAQGVELVGVHHVPCPLEKLGSDEGGGLVEIGEIVEPALEHLGLVVAGGAMIVAWTTACPKGCEAAGWMACVRVEALPTRRAEGVVVLHAIERGHGGHVGGAGGWLDVVEHHIENETHATRLEGRRELA